MKKIKYLISIVFISFIFIFIADNYLAHLESFENNYMRTSFYKPKNSSREEMLSELESQAKENNLYIFTTRTHIDSDLSLTKYVYISDGGAKILKNNEGISDKKFKGLFYKDSKIVFKDFKDVEDTRLLEFTYLIGNMKDARTFKRATIDKYAGSFPHIRGESLNPKRNVYISYFLAFIFLNLLTLFEVKMNKKEYFIRYLYGEDLKNIFLKNIFEDFLFIFLIYFALRDLFYGGLNFNTYFLSKIGINFLIVYQIADILINLSIFATDYKISFGVGFGGRKGLVFIYIFNVLGKVFMALVMTFAIGLSIKANQYFSQYDFFKSMKNFSYYSLVTGDELLASTDKVSSKIYENKLKSRDTFMSVYLDEGIKSHRPMILVDKNSLSYLRDNIAGIKNIDFDKDYYFLIPKGKDIGQIDDLKFIAKIYFDRQIKAKTIYYNDDCNIIGLNKEDQIISSFYKNPLIIVNNTNKHRYFNTQYILQASMINIKNDEWKNVIIKNKLDSDRSYITGVYDFYLKKLSSYKRMNIFSICLFLNLFFLNILIVGLILKLEFSINAKEIAVKSVLGYEKFEKYKKIFGADILSIFISFIIGLILNVIYIKINPLYICLSYIALLLVDILLVNYYIEKYENKDLVNILKGDFR
ncbi:MAG: DUF1430 domain-containing protein [Peptoniphilaceae bacterium]|nr:DUF1430 domain-containing protein [Peptoniphilaceae bacterium]MDY6019460.1 DUF1430 domain-containing protein [Anaerococcus sp.]